MATKRTKEVLVSAQRVIATELKPRDIDAKYYGDEPLFATQPDEDRRSLALVVAFNWYNKFFSAKDAKTFLSDYARVNGMTDQAPLITRATDSEVLTTLGWLSRMYSRGLNLTSSEQESLRSEITRLAKSVSKPSLLIDETAAQEKAAAEAASRPNIQEIMRERTREAGGEMEGWFDDFIQSGAKGSDVNVNSVGILSERNILPQHVSILTEVWKLKLDEFETVLSGSDPQLNEAYRHFTKTQLKGLVKFCEAVLASLNSYVSIKKANKTPRKRKAVSPEKVVAKLKYLKEFAELKLTSVQPKTLVGAAEIWLYDTEKRKLIYYVADDHIGTMSIKGTTIIGFDSTKSGVKTVRKPQDVLKKLMSSGKPASRKVFTEINSVHAQPNGRTNDAMIILKAY